MIKKLDYVSTYATELFNLASMLLVHKLAALFWGPLGFSEYSLSRRVIALVLPLVVFGLDMGLSRSVARVSGDPRNAHAKSYFVSALLIVGIGGSVWLIVVNLQKEIFSTVFFGNPEHIHLIQPVSLIIFGMALHQVACSFLRGAFRIRQANAAQLLVVGVFPIIAFWIGGTVSSSLYALAFLVGSLSLAVLVILIQQYGLYACHRCDMKRSTKELLVYGAQRMIGAFALIALFSLPSLITAHIDGVRQAGYVAFATSLMTMLGGLFAPIGLVLLPKISRMIGENRLDSLYQSCLYMLISSIVTSLCIILFLELLIGDIVRIFLGSEFVDVIDIVRIVLIGGVPYVVYMTMRSVTEAFGVVINTRNIVIALATFVVLASVAWTYSGGVQAVLSAFVVSLWMLGLLTMFHIQKIWRTTRPSRSFTMT